MCDPMQDPLHHGRRKLALPHVLEMSHFQE